jgi:hypothetical protein
VDIKSLPEAAAESLRRLTSETGYADVAEREATAMQQVEAILLKKAENRPVTPEEYQVLTNFVDRVEREVRVRQGAERQARAEKLAEVRAGIPAGAYLTGLADVGLSDRLQTILLGAGYETAGKVLEKVGIDPDSILALEGIGPKSMEEIEQVLRAFEYPEPVVEAPAEAALEEAVVEAGAQAAEPAVEAAAAPEAEAAAVAEAVPTEVTPQAVPEAAEAAAPAEAAVEPVVFEVPAAIETEEEEEEAEAPAAAGKKAKKGKKGARVVEFDETLGEMVVKRRRKPGRAGELGTFEEFEE